MPSSKFVAFSHTFFFNFPHTSPSPSLSPFTTLGWSAASTCFPLHAPSTHNIKQPTVTATGHIILLAGAVPRGAAIDPLPPIAFHSQERDRLTTRQRHRRFGNGRGCLIVFSVGKYINFTYRPAAFVQLRHTVLYSTITLHRWDLACLCVKEILSIRSELGLWRVWDLHLVSHPSPSYSIVFCVLRNVNGILISTIQNSKGHLLQRVTPPRGQR